MVVLVVGRAVHACDDLLQLHVYVVGGMGRTELVRGCDSCMVVLVGA